MISHRIWTERFASDPNVIGRTVKMNGRVRQIVGVAPAGFRFPETADFFIPSYYEPGEDARGSRYLEVVGRLKPGVSSTQANAEVAAIGADLARQYPKSNQGTTLRWSRPVGRSRPATSGTMLAVMMAAVGLRAAHRLRQRGQPPARARRGPARARSRSASRSARPAAASCASS